MSVLFIDSETTGLDPREHVPWEVAIIEPDGTEHVWFWRPSNVRMAIADRTALEIGGFHDRAPTEYDWAVESQAAEDIFALTEGNILVGSKPSFDMEILTPWLHAWGHEPAWHHRPVCVATMAYGWLLREPLTAGERAEVLSLPWKSDDLSRACGVEPPTGDERHSALGDARWVARLYRHLTGGGA